MRPFVLPVLAAALLQASPALAFRNYTVPSSSMMPTLAPSAVVTAALYGLDYRAMARGAAPEPNEDPAFQPGRGDVAFFTAPDGTTFVMRIVGLGGDRVQMIGGALHLNGKPVPAEPVPPVAGACPDGAACAFVRETLPGEAEGHIVISQQENGPGDDTAVFDVPDGHFFVMGDNRDNAADSRFGGSEFGLVGFVPREAMIGRLHAVLFAGSPE